MGIITHFFHNKKDYLQAKSHSQGESRQVDAMIKPRKACQRMMGMALGFKVDATAKSESLTDAWHHQLRPP